MFRINWRFGNHSRRLQFTEERGLPAAFDGLLDVTANERIC